MSYTFLLESGEESSAVNYSDIPRYVLLNLNPIADKSYSNGNGTASCQSSQFGTMSPHSMESLGVEKLTLSQEASLAKTLAEPAAGPALQENEADCGERWPGSLTKYDPNTRSWKIAQCSLLGDS